MDFESSAPGFTLVFQSVCRLASFHKVEQEDCQDIAIEAALTHPDDIQAAIKTARRALNDLRRQRIATRRIDERVDGGDEQADMEKTLSRGGDSEFAHLSNLDDEGEYLGEGTDFPGDKEDEVYEDLRPHLPKVTPHDTMSAIIYWAGQGGSTEQIATLVGITTRRVQQLLNDTKAIRAAVHSTQMELDMPWVDAIPAPRPRRHYNPRKPRGHADKLQAPSVFKRVVTGGVV